MATRRPFMGAGQPGINQTSNIAGTEQGAQPMPPPVAGMGPRPSMMMGGNGQPQNPAHGPMGASPMSQDGGMPPAMTPPPALPPVDPFAGGPTSPMNIQSMLSPQQQPPGQQPQQSAGPSLMPWGQQGGMYGSSQQPQQPPTNGVGPETDASQPVDIGGDQPQVMIRLLRAMGQI